MQTQDVYKKLVDLLNDQVNVHSHLLQLIENEKSILISASLDSLNENNRAKEAMISRIRDLERDRIVLTKDLGLRLGISKGNPTISELVARALPETAQDLRAVQQSLLLLIERVQDANRNNEYLVESALQNISGAMGSVRDQVKENPTYKRQGHINKGATSSGRLVSKEV